MWDNILDFIEDHRILCFIIIGVVILTIILFSVRSSNLKKKAQLEEEQARQEELLEQERLAALEQDEVVEEQPKNDYKNQLGLDANKDDDGRVEVKPEKEKPSETPEPEPEKAFMEPKVIVYGHTEVPNSNMDGSSCKAYLSGVKLSDFGTMWGTSLTEKDFKGNEKYLIGVDQNKEDFMRGDLNSTGWLISNINDLKANDAVKFTNLHVIGSLSNDHVALLCSYDWYSAFGMKDTLVVFEDISGTLKTNKFSAGDIFSAVVFRHNIKVLNNVNGQRVIVTQYAVFE